MDLYQATLETVPNNCYVETVIIIAESKEDAHEQLVKKNGQWGVTYTMKLEKLSIDTTKKQVIIVGLGRCSALATTQNSIYLPKLL